jgi:hypothetical protein
MGKTVGRPHRMRQAGERTGSSETCDRVSGIHTPRKMLAAVAAAGLGVVAQEIAADAALPIRRIQRPLGPVGACGQRVGLVPVQHRTDPLGNRVDRPNGVDAH